jgi:hypothetical protein
MKEIQNETQTDIMTDVVIETVLTDHGYGGLVEVHFARKRKILQVVGIAKPQECHWTGNRLLETDNGLERSYMNSANCGMKECGG